MITSFVCYIWYIQVMRTLVWMGTSLDDVKRFPDAVQDGIG